MSMTIQDIIVMLRTFDQYTSPAPWSVTPYQLDKDTACWVVKDCKESEICSRISDHRLQADFEFIRESRNALPSLVSEIERLTAENLELKRENHLAWSKGHAAGWDCHIVTMQSAELTKATGAHHDRS